MVMAKKAFPRPQNTSAKNVPNRWCEGANYLRLSYFAARKGESRNIKIGFH
jgi:hypothetical protein